MPSATDLLKQDHRAVEEMFENFRRRGDEDTVRTICEELARHAAIEEAVIYPTLKDEVSPLVADRSQRDHDRMKELIASVRSAGGSDLRELVERLREETDKHVREEEGEVLPGMEFKLGPGRMEKLGRKIEELKSETAMITSPTTEGSAVGSSMVGGGMASLTKLSKTELYERARRAGVKGRSSMTKDELVHALEARTR